MASRPISPRVHAVLDYATGAKLTFLAPALLGLGGTASGRILRGAGVATLGLSALTRYELGVRKVVPFRAHLAVDAANAAGVAAAPFLLRTASQGPRHWLPHVLVGAAELAIVALTDASEPAAEPGNEHLATAASTPDPAKAVMPDGVEANARIGARTIGGSDRTGSGIGSGTGPGSDPGVGGQQV